MKFFILLIGFLLIAFFSFCQSQGEMNEEAAKNYAKADKELNNVYTKILEEYKEDTTFIKYLKVSQRLWIQFRDAEMNMKYPEAEGDPNYYGSVFPMCWSIYEEELTRERIKKLKVWLEGIKEGDVCAGSVKIKE